MPVLCRFGKSEETHNLTSVPRIFLNGVFILMNLFSFNDYLTIDIGFRYIKVVQVRKSKNDDLTIINYGIGDTPKGAIKNGAIKDKRRVTKEIKKIMVDNMLSSRNAKIVISGTNIITRVLMVDRLEEMSENVDARIWDEIKQCMPIDLDEHKVDYKILGVTKVKDVEKTKVFVTAVSKKIINSYIDILRDLNLKPLAVDIPANGVSKFFKKNISNKTPENLWGRRKAASLNTNTIAVIDLGSETTIINILKDKTPEFNRVALLGSSNIDTEIFKDLDLDKGQEYKAEMYKKMYGIANAKDPNNELEWQCSSSAKIVINEVMKNIRMCFDFYVSRCAGEEVSSIYLIGGGSQMRGLKQYFEEVLSIPTYPVNLLEIEGVEFTTSLDSEKVNYLINALGAAL